MLDLEDQAILQQFVARSVPDDAYLRRVQILLLASDGLATERIAAEVGVSTAQVRNFLRAYQKQGLALFPADLFKPPPPFRPEETLNKAARLITRMQLDAVDLWLPQVIAEADETAVHELRKTIRQLRAAMRFFAPYFEPGLLAGFRRKLRRLMRALAESRDLAVFTADLVAYIEQANLTAAEQAALAEMLTYWQERRTAVDRAMQKAVGHRRWPDLLAALGEWADNSELGSIPARAGKVVPEQTRHLLPVLVYQEVAEVRAFEAVLAAAPLPVWHDLRIHMKRLRYLLEFFELLLGAPASGLIIELKEMLENLGALNDARVALELLTNLSEEIPGAVAVSLYKAAQEAKIKHYKAEFDSRWRLFNQVAWRQKLAMALVVL